jgi:CubicO group peptidase (beta-lactamase class C family)
MKKLNAEILNQKIEEIARWDFEQKKVFGSAYWVCQNGKVVCEKYFGETGIESGVPVTEKTIFRLASMTKPVTAVAALILIDRGLITLSDPVSKFLPEWVNVPIIDLKDGKQTVLGLPQKPPTVMNLLTHTSGIGSNDEKRFAIPEKDLETVDSYQYPIRIPWLSIRQMESIGLKQNVRLRVFGVVCAMVVANLWY